MGVLVGAVQRGDPLLVPLAFAGAVFILLQVLTPIHQAVGANLGDRTAAWLHDRLAEACVRPPGLGHLENPKLTNDLTVARDFDLGMTGPPLSISMDFIASGLVEMIGGLASAVVLAFYAWWAPLVLGGAWLATHWLLRESAIWRDRNTDEVRAAQRDADYAYRLAVDPPSAKELRLFGLAGWTIDRFINRRTRLHALQYQATRLREKPVLWSLLLVIGANLAVFWSLASAAAGDRLTLAEVVVFAQSAVGTSMIAFGGLNWALDGSAAPVAAVLRLEPEMAPAGALPSGARPATGLPARELRFRDVTFGYPGGPPVLEHFDLVIPAGIVDGHRRPERRRQDHAGQIAVPPLRSAVRRRGGGRRRRAHAVARLVARSRDRGVPGLHPLRAAAARQRRPGGRARRGHSAMRSRRPARRRSPSSTPSWLAATTTAPISPAASGSASPWRARSARCKLGAGVVLLDEPTAQLDVRGEAEIFDRILSATRHCTTILISHRFSTVRQADRICVLERGRVIELGSHDELMARRGRYCEMFELQAQRFVTAEDEQGMTFDVLN